MQAEKSPGSICVIGKPLIRYNQTVMATVIASNKQRYKNCAAGDINTIVAVHQ